MPSNGTAGKVLIVEDDEPSRIALETLLEQEGFAVRSAGDGREAVSLAASYQPDVILLDLVLPMLNGFDAAARLKSNAATSTIPLVAVTASWLGTDGERLRSIGFAAAFRKPFSPAALIAELRNLLQD